MEPEIARRCPKCGASVRGGAFFCPQCGTPVKAVGAAGVVRSAAEAAEKSNGGQTDAGGNSSFTGAATVNEAHAPSTKTAPRIEEAEKHWKRHRVSSAREAVGEKIAPRMEKLRQASTVMLDEASYDPSLRFVLVAVGIFLLTLLLFLLHGLIG